MLDERLYDEKELEKSWLISYSDLFTLLFVIIVMIAAAHSARLSSQMDEVKQAEKQVHESVDLLQLKKLELEREIHQLEARRNALLGGDFGSSGLIAGDDADGQDGASHGQTETNLAQRDMETVRTQLAAALQELNIDFEETGEGLMVRLPESILFASGSADLQQEGKTVIGSIAQVLQRFTQRVRIEGYTDDVPVTHSPYRSNWELSSDRSIAVMREMVDVHGLPASRFTIAGWGELKPLVDNSNEENRARNRRVEIVILAEKE